MQPGPLIGKGLTAEVFAWGEGRVVKLFFSPRPFDKIELELMVTRAVRAGGYPAPNAYEIVHTNGRYGLIMDRVEGISMVKSVEKRPWTFLQGARLLAELHAELHSRAAPPELPTQRSRIETWITQAADLQEADRRAAVDSLPLLPDGNALCHGDFHPDNVLFTSKGPVVIDWSGATRGHPIGDVARTASLIKRAELPKDAPIRLRWMLQFSRSLLLRTYLKRYFQLRPGSPRELDLWEPAQKAAASAWRSVQDI